MARKIVINPEFEALRDFVESIPAKFAHEGRIIYDARNQIRVFTLPNGTEVNVKRYCVPMFFNRLIYSCFRQPKVLRAYEYAVKLKELGVSTPQRIAYILDTTCGFIAHSYLITEQAAQNRMLYEFGKGDLNGRESIVKGLAQFAAQLHEKGVYHKDFSPGNILFNIVDDVPQFTIVDINRMEFGAVDMDKGCRNFARLWGKSAFFELLADEYAAARGFDKTACRELIMKYRCEFWKTHDRTLYDYE